MSATRRLQDPFAATCSCGASIPVTHEVVPDLSVGSRGPWLVRCGGCGVSFWAERPARDRDEVPE